MVGFAIVRCLEQIALKSQRRVSGGMIGHQNFIRARRLGTGEGIHRSLKDIR